MIKNIPIDNNFHRFLSERAGPGIVWDLSCSDERHRPFADLAGEVSDINDGIDKFLLGVAVQLATNTPLSLTYLGEFTSDDGGTFHAFLFIGRNFEVVSCVEDDCARSRTVWRGDEGAYDQAALSLLLSDHAAEDIVP